MYREVVAHRNFASLVWLRCIEYSPLTVSGEVVPSFSPIPAQVITFRTCFNVRLVNRLGLCLGRACSETNAQHRGADDSVPGDALHHLTRIRRKFVFKGEQLFVYHGCRVRGWAHWSVKLL